MLNVSTAGRLRPLLVLFIALTGPLLPAAAATPTEVETKRREIRAMRDEVVAELVRLRPEAAQRLKRAAGYAVFSNVGIKLFVAGTANGRGVVTRTRWLKDELTYMRMASVGLGLGFGVKDFRVVFIFHDEQALRDFVERGWDFSGEVDASLKSDRKGGGLSKSANLTPAVEVFQLTKSGIALQATLQGTKYWRDKKLD